MFATLAEKCLSHVQAPMIAGMTKAMLKDLCNLASTESDSSLVEEDSGSETDGVCAWISDDCTDSSTTGIILSMWET